MSGINKEYLAEIIRRGLVLKKGRITPQYLKSKLSTADVSLGEGDFIALSYIFNQAIEKDPAIAQDLEDFITHNGEIGQIMGYRSPRAPSTPMGAKPAEQTGKKKKNERRKIVETQIILNKMIASIYKQPVNSRSI